MNRAYVKCYLQRKVPSVSFKLTDEQGRQYAENLIHCVVPEKDVFALESAAKDVGQKAVWPVCSSTGGHHRIIEMN